MDSAATFLTAEEDNGPTKLYFQWDGFASHAVIVRKAPGAVILCIPKHAAIMSALEEAETGGFEGAIGPFMEVELVAAGASGRSTKRPLSSILMDFEASGLAEHVSASPSAEVGAKDYVKFGTHRSQHEWPSKHSLAAACQTFLGQGGARLDLYFSAAEELELEEEELEEGAEAAPGAPTDQIQILLNQLLSQSAATQQTIAGMQGRLQGLDALNQRLTNLEKKSVQAATASRPAPQLFTPPNGPLDNKQLDHLHALAGQGPGRVGDIGPRTGSGAKVSLRTTEAPDPELDGESLSQPGPAEPATLERLLHSQTQILQQLATQRATSQDPLAMLLHGGNGRRPRRAAQVRLGEGHCSPPAPDGAFQAKARESVGISERKVGSSPQEGECCRVGATRHVSAFYRDSSLWSHKTLTHLAFLTAKMWEHSERGETEHLRALVGLTAVFAEQAAYDSGGLRLAHLLTCADEPPFAQTELHSGTEDQVPTCSIGRTSMGGNTTGLICATSKQFKRRAGSMRGAQKPPDPVGDRDKDKGKWRNNKKGKGKQSDDMSGESWAV